MDGLLRVGTMEIQSKSLLRNLKGCGQVVLFGATLGAGVDRLIRRVSLTDMARAVVLQACAAAELEEYCDEQQKKISTELEKVDCIFGQGSALDMGTSRSSSRSRS